MINCVGVIGLGNISIRHRKNVRSLFPTARIIALSASGRKVHDDVECSDYIARDLAELIELSPDFVIVASPASFHLRHSLPLIKKNIPLIIEKPVTTSIKDADILISAAQFYQTPVTVGYCLRYLPSALRVNQLLKENIIGDLYNVFANVGQYLPNWRPKINYEETVSAKYNLGGGALFELSHEIDYLQWFLGEMNVRFAHLRVSSELNIDVEDIVDVCFTNTLDVVCNMHLDLLQKFPQRKCCFIGAAGRLDWDLLNNSIKLSDSGGEKILYEDNTFDKNKMYMDMLVDFSRLIKSESNNCISLQEASKTIFLIEQVKNFTKKEIAF